MSKEFALKRNKEANDVGFLVGLVPTLNDVSGIDLVTIFIKTRYFSIGLTLGYLSSA